MSKFDHPGTVNEVVWDMRLADLPRAEDRATLQRLFSGNPPYDEEKAEENNIEINYNDLEGPNMLMQARRQWNNAMLKPGNFFNITLDSGPVIKRSEDGHKITKNLNKHLKRTPRMSGQRRATGANALLFGQGPTSWTDRHAPIPKPIPVASLLVPSETEIDAFGDNEVPYVGIFRELTLGQLLDMTYGPRVDPGWNMDLVNSQIKWVREQTQKQTNASAYQYMPERIEELLKQDKGFFGTDAVPTVDIWDFFFQEENGVYRRIILDWGAEATGYAGKTAPERADPNGQFLYSSGKRKYANNISEIVALNFADCSPYAPFRYHSVRSLGWMLWGVCNLQNRLHCKFNEAVFEQLMWFFRVAGDQDLKRLKKANFTHMGVIPQGVSMITADERFKPDVGLVEAAFARNRGLMNDAAASFRQDVYSQSEKEKTATQVMAEVNSVNALVSGMLELAYTYEAFKDREICRRFCIKNSKSLLVQNFRKDCLRDGVDAEMLDVERWNLEEEQVLGGGNKTLQMAAVNYLNTVRKNLGPQGQRIVDHIGIEAVTDQSDLAEQMAPLRENIPISNSAHDAQLSTERLLDGLPFADKPDMVYEDYVKVWLSDLAMKVQQAQQQGGMATIREIQGFANLAQHIAKFLGIMAQDPESKPRVREYHNALGKIGNLVKAFAQRLAQQMKARDGQGGMDPKALAAVMAEKIKATAKAQNMRESHAMRTAQKQAQFELEEQRKDRELNAELRREGARTRQELIGNRMRMLR